MRLNALGKIRRALQAIDILITRRSYRLDYFRPPDESPEIERWKNFFLRLDAPPGADGYLGAHLDRLARTMSIVPRPKGAGRALELGCYMQMTPALGLELKYGEVRGAYYGPPGHGEVKTASIGGREVFRCRVDTFDAERDPYPYADEHFDCVLACEIIEHLKLDPMHLLLEIRRVLAPGGALVVTTPNCASLGSVMRLLHGFQSPQIFSCYPDPRKREGDSPHVREYTPFELSQLLDAAGFRIEEMFTGRIGGYEEGTWVYDLLQRNGFDTKLRGEQIYCRAVKIPGAPLDRYPSFLYEA